MKKLKTWESHYRYSYNKAIGILNGDCIDYNNADFATSLGKIEATASTGTYYSKFSLRDLIVPESVNSRSQFVLETGSAIRSKAVFEAHKAYKTNIDLVMSGTKKFFNLGFKKKKARSWTIEMEKANIKEYADTWNGKSRISLYNSIGEISITEKIPSIENDCKVIFDGKHYYLAVPYTKVVKTSSAKNWFCALDPGIRKFQTLYSPDSDYLIIGNRASTRVYKLLLKLDSAISNGNKQLQVKLRNKIAFLQKELHDKASRFLCENYNIIYIPKLTKENDIISTRSRKIKTKTVRNMVLLGHCKFIEKLKTKALEYTNVKVNIVTEEYTSQTCTKCKKRTKVSGEIFVCKFCNHKEDRDLLGSRNILLRAWSLLK